MDWTPALTADRRRAIAELAAVAAGVDDTAPLSEQVLGSLDGDTARHATLDVGDEIVGYANLLPPHEDNPPMAEVVVAPRHRRNGIGSRLVAAALDQGGPGTRVWAHGDIPAARALARRVGLVGLRELLQLRRPLGTDPLPELTVAEGVSLRTYRGPADDDELLRVNNAAFAWHPEQGGWTERDIAARRESSWFDPAGLFVAVDARSDRVLGFHWTKVHTDGAHPIGEVYVVAVDPQAQGLGLGRQLTLAGLHYLRERGLGSVLLYVEADNESAVHTYSRLGFERFHADVAYGYPPATGETSQ